jgi:hypothetical protein
MYKQNLYLQTVIDILIIRMNQVLILIGTVTVLNINKFLHIFKFYGYYNL